MNEQPEALRLAEWLDGSSNGPLDARHNAAAELRRLHEANEAFASRQTWWNNRMFEMEAALRKTQKPIAWIYAEGLQALKSGKPWVAYGTEGDGRIPLFLNTDAVAPRVEPRASESGAGFESLPASPHKPMERNT